jgi:enamine deaminase RidA (YjgF/YER057c/UK114 family)
MSDVSRPEVTANVNLVNPETLHRPTGYSHVAQVTAGRLAYISGQVALDRAGELVGPGDIRAQARQVFENLRAALKAVDAGFEVRDEYVDPRRLPASTAVQVGRLFREDLLIEVEAVAVTT